jgi:hypothetical protein
MKGERKRRTESKKKGNRIWKMKFFQGADKNCISIGPYICRKHA